MNLKKKIWLTVALFVLVVIVLVPAILLFNGISAFSAANQSLNRSVQELRSLYNKDPFPSRDNIKLEKKNVLAMGQWFDRLVTALQEGQITEEPSTPTGFITHYGHVRNNLMKLARQRDKKMVSDDFAFGFARYSEGSLPVPVDVARLMQQLQIIEQVSIVLVESGVKQITGITREEFEAAAVGEAGDSTTSEPRTERRRPSSSRRSPARTPERPVNNPAAAVNQRSTTELSYKQHFTVEVRAMESTSIELLDRLASHKMFIVVTAVTFRKRGNSLRMPKAEKDETEIQSPDEPVNAKPVTDNKDQPRQKRKVSGPDFEIAMSVTIDFDVYTFESDSAE